MRVRLQSGLRAVHFNCWYAITAPSSTYNVQDLKGQIQAELKLDVKENDFDLEVEGYDLPLYSAVGDIVRDGDLIVLRPRRETQALIERRESFDDDLSEGRRRDVRDRETGVYALHDRCTEEREGSNASTDSSVARNVELYQQIASLEAKCEIMYENMETLMSSRSTAAGVNHAQKEIEVLSLALKVMDDEVKHLKRGFETFRRQTKDTLQGLRTGQSTPVVVMSQDLASSVNAESASEETDSDSSDETDDSDSDSQESESTSESSSSPSVHETSLKSLLQPIPFNGTAPTLKRNDRRKRQRQLQRLKDAQILPPDADFRTLEKFQNGEKLVPQETQPEIAQPAWDYPDSPEPGWEQRLVVKEVECELDPLDDEVEDQVDEVEEPSKRQRTSDLQVGAEVAFTYCTMKNFNPETSFAKATVIVPGDVLELQLFDEYVSEPYFDYDGDRVPGPYDALDDDGNVIDGRIRIVRSELIDLAVLG